MQIHYTKESLYKEIRNLRNCFGISYADYPLDLQSKCKAMGTVQIGLAPFETPGLRGMLYLADNETEYNVILLNKNNTFAEQNFYCGHELLHLALHSSAGPRAFNCFEKVKPQQDPFMEWHANEGSAELLLPYELFIPELFKLLSPNQNMRLMYQVRCDLAARFNVSERVVYTRVESLKYEIAQFQLGIDIKHVELLSLTQQVKKGIRVSSFNTQENIHY